MKESATIAMEYIKANADEFGLDPEVFENIMFIFMFQKEQHQKMDQVQVLLC